MTPARLLLTVLAAGAASADVFPCEAGPLKGSPACDVTLSLDLRAEYIVSQIEPDEKLTMFGNAMTGVPRLGIGAYNWWSEGLHGVADSPGVSFAPPTPSATSFPQVITTSASFNKTLYKTIASAISTEGRAFNNAGHAGLSYWTPNINLIRDPRWGRGHETPGEDPIHTAIYAAEFVPGMQEGEDPGHLKTSACCKHYYAYDLEDWGGVDRHHFNAIITKQDETDTYLPAFHSCVANGKASGMMCSYNSVNGTPSCANERIMNGFARGSWGFDGYITSDCGAVGDVWATHKYESDPAKVCTDVLTAGMDSDCGTFVNVYLNQSVRANDTSMSTVDAALQHLFKVQLRFGFFDPPAGQPYFKYTYSEKVNTPEHQKLALDAARDSLVLLKNDGETFPLDRSKYRTVAVVGPNANATTTMQANYYGVAPYLISPLEGISRYVTATYAEGCNTSCPNTFGFSEAVTAAQNSDATVLIIGISTAQEAEGLDRTSIALPGYQEMLIKEVSRASRGPVMVVVMAGGSVDFNVAKYSEDVEGILWVGYPGQSGGQAIAEVVFGDVNPSGRLPHTQYPKDYLENLSMFDMNMRPGVNNSGRTYRFYTGIPVYSFGSGMSYTRFEYLTTTSSLSVELSDVEADCEQNNKRGVYSPTAASPTLAQVSVKVTNVGDRAGGNSLLGFSKSPFFGRNGAPLSSLFDHEKVFLKPGQSAQVVFNLTSFALSLADASGDRHAERGQWTLSFGADDDLTVPVNVQ